MLARIYKPAKTAMQSGRGNTNEWLLEYDQETARRIEPIMGWTSSSDMRSQLRIRFDTKEEAVQYCQRHKIPYKVVEPKERRLHKKAYADNFRFNRAQTWTH